MKPTVSFLLPLVVSLILIRSAVSVSEEVESRLICRGRCAVIGKLEGEDYRTCLDLCCSSSESEYSVDCPLFGYNSCSTPDTPSESPDLSIENGTILLPFNTNALEKGIPLALTEQNSEVSSNDIQVILVKSVHFSSQVVNYQLFYAGGRNELDLNITDCYNVSLAVINECGLSNFSAASDYPPSDLLSNLKVSSAIVEKVFPKVTISWKFAGTTEFNPVFNISMKSNIPTLECPSLERSLNGIHSDIELFPEDFSDRNVFLCFYNIKVLVAYSLSCKLVEDSQDIIEEQITLEEPITINLTEAELIWNSISLAYSLKLSWTVPEIYNLSHSILFFMILDLNNVAIRNPTIRATAGKLKYEVVVFEDKLKPLRRGSYNFYINPLTRGTKYNPPPVRIGLLSAPGEPPSSVMNVTITEKDRNTLQINWQEPAITNGNITGYSLSVTIRGKDRIIFETTNITNITNTHFVFDMTRASKERGEATAIFFTVSAINMYGASHIVSVIYALNSSIVVDGIEATSDDGLVAGIVVPIALVTIVMVIVIIAIFAMLVHQRRHIKQTPMVPLLLSKDYEYKLYFKRLPPAMVDRWIIPLHMFNSESFHLLGEGNFSSVYFSLVHGPLSTPTKLDQFKNYSEQSVAVKILKGNASEMEMEAFLNEAEILKTLSTQSCPYVVHLVGLQLEHAPPMIAMELVPCGNMLDILKSSALTDENGDEPVFTETVTHTKKKLQKTDTQLTLIEFQKERAGSIDSYVQLRKISITHEDSSELPSEARITIKPSQLLKFAIQIVRGMEYLQSFGILHRDLACRNLLLSASGIVKISDFGFACFLDGKTEIVAELPTDSKPLRWMSPEAFEDSLFSEASDVWSFGVTLWELFSQGKFPYPTLSDSDVLAAVKAGNYLECPEKCDEKVYNLMLNCWKLSRKDRPQFSVLKKTLEGFMYDLYPYMLMEVQEVPDE